MTNPLGAQAAECVAQLEEDGNTQLLTFDFDLLDGHQRQGREYRKGLYPRPPAVIARTWSVLAPALVELAEHIRPDVTLQQVVRGVMRSTKKPMAASASGQISVAEAQLLRNWLGAIFIMMGTLPIDPGESSKLQSVRAMRRAADGAAAPSDAGLSSQCRLELQSCLEMVGVKLWRAHHVERRSPVEIQLLLYRTLQYLYWECGVPNDIALLWDELPEVTDPLFDEVRRINYQQLYLLESEGRLDMLLRLTQAGTAVLLRHRLYNASIFRARVRRDARATLPFERLCADIDHKYTRDADDDFDSSSDNSSTGGDSANDLDDKAQ